MHGALATSAEFNLHSFDIKLRYFLNLKLKIIQKITKIVFSNFHQDTTYLHNIYIFKDLQLFRRYAIYFYHADYRYMYIHIHTQFSKKTFPKHAAW